jgi:hypothetical protein
VQTGHPAWLLSSVRQDPPWQDRQAPQSSQQVWSETQRFPQTFESGRSPQLPFWHSRQPPVQPGPGWLLGAFWQRLFTQALQAPPQSAAEQQFPSTQVEPQSRRPPWQEPLHG